MCTIRTYVINVCLIFMFMQHTLHGQKESLQPAEWLSFESFPGMGIPTKFMGILATPPKATLPKNKALIRPY